MQDIFKKTGILKFGFLSLIAFSLGVQGQESFPRFPSKKGLLSIELSTEWFDSQENFRELGLYTKLPDGNFFQYLDFSPSIVYFPRNWISLELFAHSFWAASKTRTNKTDKYLQIYQFTHTGVGLFFHKEWSSLYLSGGLKASLPLAVPTAENIVIGDGSYHIEPAINLTYSLSPHFLYIFYNTSLLFRTHQLSTLSHHKLGAFIQTRFIDFGFAMKFFLPLIPDYYTLNPRTRWDLTDANNGGSYKVYSINPNSLSFTTWMDWKLFKHLSFNTFANIDTYGQFYGKGYTVGVLTKLLFETRSSQKTNYKNKKLNTVHEEEGDYFEEEASSINRELKNELKKLR